jgi:hypothetical protein
MSDGFEEALARHEAERVADILEELATEILDANGQDPE